jgi:hypothetical protein
MRTVAPRSAFALSLFACLVAGPAVAQVGPIQPVLVLNGGQTETSHRRPDLPENYAIPVDVYVAADGTVSDVVVSESSKDLVADQLAAAVMRDKLFLPALDSKGQPTVGVAKVTVSMYKRGSRKVVKVIVKPPALAGETERVNKMMCADFLWEVERLRKEADVDDAAYEVMPYVSARMYMTQKHISSEVESKFWDAWPGALKKVIDRCAKDELKFFFAEVLTPTLDGAMPELATVTASAEK